jgi:hypothetical protein
MSASADPERHDEGWHIALFQNTLVESHTAEIERVRAAGATVG